MEVRERHFSPASDSPFHRALSDLDLSLQKMASRGGPSVPPELQTGLRQAIEGKSYRQISAVVQRIRDFLKHSGVSNIVVENLCENILEESSSREEPAGLAMNEEVAIQMFRRELLIEGYELQEEIGKGGMGRVFKAFEPTLERSVAVKTINSPDEDLKRRFVQEARVQAEVTEKHPELFSVVYRAGMTENGTAFLAMNLEEGLSKREVADVHPGVPPELCEGLTKMMSGEDLKKKVRLMKEYLGDSFPRDAWTTISVFLHAKLGTIYQGVNERGIYHRDIKPANHCIDVEVTKALVNFWNSVFVEKEITREKAEHLAADLLVAPVLQIEHPVKVLDFGLSKKAASGVEQAEKILEAEGALIHTDPKKLQGTNGFIPPQATVSPCPDFSDRFAWAMSLIQTITGRHEESTSVWNLVKLAAKKTMKVKKRDENGKEAEVLKYPDVPDSVAELYPEMRELLSHPTFFPVATILTKVSPLSTEVPKGKEAQEITWSELLASCEAVLPSELREALREKRELEENLRRKEQQKRTAIMATVALSVLAVLGATGMTFNRGQRELSSAVSTSYIGRAQDLLKAALENNDLRQRARLGISELAQEVQKRTDISPQQNKKLVADLVELLNQASRIRCPEFLAYQSEIQRLAKEACTPGNESLCLQSLEALRKKILEDPLPGVSATEHRRLLADCLGAMEGIRKRPIEPSQKGP